MNAPADDTKAHLLLQTQACLIKAHVQQQSTSFVGNSSYVLQACPCTSEALCKADESGKFKSDCSWNSNTPGYWYFGHGGKAAA